MATGTRARGLRGARRRLGGAVLLAAAIALAAGCKARGPRHVIFFIGDGMHLECEVAASRYLFGADRGLAWHAFPERYYVSTWDVPTYNRYAWQRGAPKFDPHGFLPTLGYDPARGGWEPYPAQTAGIEDGYFLSPLPGYGVRGASGGSPPAPDSAAAATAMATGWKTDGGNIAWRPGDPEGGRLETILETFRAKRRGAIGAVSTVPFNHATPAAYIGHNVNRSNYYTGFRRYAGEGLADEIIRRVKPDVVIGGGHPLLCNPDFDPAQAYISRGLVDELRSSTDYVLAERRPGEDGARTLAAAADTAIASGKKLFGLFGGERGDFDAPVAADAPGAPGFSRPSTEDPLLKDAVLAALRRPQREPAGLLPHGRAGQHRLGEPRQRLRTHDRRDDRPRRSRQGRRGVRRPARRRDRLEKHDRRGRRGPRDRLPEARPEQRSWARGICPARKSGPRRPSRNWGRSRRPGEPMTSPYLYPDGEVSYATSAHTNELVPLSVRGATRGRFGAAAGRWYGGRILDNTQIYDALVEALRLPVDKRLRPVPAAAPRPEEPSARR